MAKNVYLDSSTIRSKFLSGVEKLAEAVGTTLGPKGRTVVLQTGPNKYITTKDGVSVAKAITVKDEIENSAICLAKEASIKTNELAGDGTTTATILQCAIMKRAIASGADVVDLSKGIEAAANVAIQCVEDLSTPASTESVFDIANISSNGDKRIANSVAAAFKEVGENGVVLVEESVNLDTYVDVIEGTQLPAGYISPYLINQDNSMKCIFENTKLVITDKKITSGDLVAISNIVKEAGNAPILFVAEDYDPEVQTALIVNKLQGRCQICAIKLSLYGEDRQTRASDLAVLTGGKLVSDTLGTSLDKFTKNMFGCANKTIVTEDKTIILGGHGNEDEINALKVQLTNHLAELDPNAFEYRKTKSRITYLDGVVAVIHVGASTAAEMKEKRDRVDDAICAVRAALARGYVPGCGVTYIRASKKVEEAISNDTHSNSSIKAGMEVLRNALYSPIETLFKNAGLDNSLMHILTDQHIDDPDMSYDINRGLWGKAMDIGVIDPTAVVVCALRNAVSSAITLLMSKAVVVDDGEEKNKPAVPQMPMM